MLADAGQVLDHVDAERTELVGVAHAGQLQQLRRVDRAAAQDDLTGHDALGAAATVRVLHADRSIALDQDLRDERPGLDVQVRTAHHGVEVRTGRRQSPAVADVAVERREPLLAESVHVLGQRVAGLLDRLEERPEQRAAGGAALQDERAGVPAILVLEPSRHAALHPLEVRQAVRVIPGVHAGVRAPTLVVQGVPALEDHAVDAARAAQDLAARVIDPTPVHVRLGLRLVLPVVVAASDRERERRRHVDEDVPQVVGTARFQHQHAVRGVGGQPVAQGAAGRSASDDHEVVPVPRHGRILPDSGYHCTTRLHLTQPLPCARTGGRPTMAA